MSTAHRSVLVSTLVIASSSASIAQSFTSLGDLPGSSAYSLASAVSADGSVVVGTSASSMGLECFTWTAATGIVGQGTIPGGTSWSYGHAVAGSSATFVFGGTAYVAAGSEAFVNMVGIGDLPGDTFDSAVYGISDDGLTYAGVGNGSSASQVAFLKSAGSLGFTALGTLPGDAVSFGRNISGDGTAVVGYSDGATRQAFRWSGGTMTPLGYLAGGSSSEAWGTNADGSVVVGSSVVGPDMVAFRWTAATGMVGLGNVTKRANACSADGRVVVGSFRYGLETRAFLWDATHGLRALEDVLIQDHGLGAALAGWKLYEATDVSADGRVIVGNGRLGSGDYAWRADLGPDTPEGFCFGAGLGTACPCSNGVGIYDHAGCRNSTGLGGRLLSSGTASVSADTLTLLGSQMPGSSSALYFQGDAAIGGGAGSLFGDGLRCVGTNVIRLGDVVNSGSGTSAYPSGAAPAVSVQGAVGAGSTKNYQVWYRNAAVFCTSASFNLTNGLRATWTP